MSSSTSVESAVEHVKRTSDYLRGELARELDTDAPSVSNDSEQLLKFHGIYAQDNRDVRRDRSLSGLGPEHIFMIRVVVPGGRLTSGQWLALDNVSTSIGDHSLRLTTRQAVQFHGVLKGDLRQLARSLDEATLSSFGGCGDVVRNVVMCPALQDSSDEHTIDLARQLRSAFRSTSEAHWEIFVNGELAASRSVREERAFYGPTYLPRKFKIAIAHPEENCVDVFANDVGLIPAHDDDGTAGFTMLVGGGLGRSYANPDTFAQLAQPLAFVRRDDLEATIGAVVAAYRDLGDRGERRRARLKYVIADHGMAFFQREVEARLGATLRAPFAVPTNFHADDHLGWRERADGTCQLGLRVGAGRVNDLEDGAQLRRALRVLASDVEPTFFITPQQDIIVSQLDSDSRRDVEAILVAHHVRLSDQLGNVERHALACPALPTCSQALGESERRLPELVTGLEDALAQRQLQRRPVQLRLTGCPNGCARPALAEIGVVGRTKSTYDLYLGGSTQGDRLALLYREKVRLEDIPELLGPWFDRWSDDGETDESFGDFLTRVGLS